MANEKNKTSKSRADAVADTLHDAYTGAKFAAAVELSRATGKPTKDLDPVRVKAVAEGIFASAAGDLIASGKAALPAPTARGSHVAREAARRGEPRSAPDADAKALLHAHKDALDALSAASRLSAEQRRGVRDYFSAAHPRMSDKSVEKARGQAALSKHDRVALAKIVEADRKKAQAGARRRSQPIDPAQGRLDLKGGGAKRGRADKTAARKDAGANRER